MADLSGFADAVFDMKKAGCVLAWEHFHPDRPMPDLFRYLQDRDLWIKELPQTEEVFSAIQGKGSDGRYLFPKRFPVWQQLIEMPISQLAAIGQPLYAKRQAQVKEMADKATWRKIAGYTVPVAEAPFFYSDVANLLCKRHPEAAFAVCYRYQDGQLKWDFRSIGEFDVSVIAKQFGGGGHKNASGAQESLSWIEKLVRFERA